MEFIGVFGWLVTRCKSLVGGDAMPDKKCSRSKKRKIARNMQLVNKKEGKQLVPKNRNSHAQKKEEDKKGKWKGAGPDFRPKQESWKGGSSKIKKATKGIRFPGVCDGLWSTEEV